MSAYREAAFLEHWIEGVELAGPSGLTYQEQFDD
jgi:hypothetical protein